MLNSICGFHHRACQRLADNRPRRLQNSTYWYYPADEAMRICKLSPIQVYIARRKQTVLAYVLKRLIYKLCREAVRSAGTLTRTKFWWEQDLSYWIELVKDDCPKKRYNIIFIIIYCRNDSVFIVPPLKRLHCLQPVNVIVNLKLNVNTNVINVSLTLKIN